MIMYKKIYSSLLVLLFCIKASVYASKRPKVPEKDNNTPMQVMAMPKSDLSDCSGIDFRDKTLPQDLRGADLTNANFTGQRFMYTDFTGAKIAGAILSNTTCDYQQCFQKSIKVNKKRFSQKWATWYHSNLPKDLKDIAEVYPNIVQNSDKALLLEIASALAYLPYYPKNEFEIKAEYWSCRLLELKRQLKKVIGDQLSCSMGNILKYMARNYCWQTDYPFHLEHPKGLQVAKQWCRLAIAKYLPEDLSLLVQHYLTEKVSTKHADFDAYLQLLEKRLHMYNTKSKHQWAYIYYRFNIKGNIEGLKKAYPQLISHTLRQEAVNIAHALLESYKKEHFHFLCHYLICQNRLIQLKRSAGRSAGYYIRYYIIDHSILSGKVGRLDLLGEIRKFI